MAKFPKMTAGAAGGMGRLQKTKAYGTPAMKPTKHPAPKSVKMPKKP